MGRCKLFRGTAKGPIKLSIFSNVEIHLEILQERLIIYAIQKVKNLQDLGTGSKFWLKCFYDNGWSVEKQEKRLLFHKNKCGYRCFLEI